VEDSLHDDNHALAFHTNKGGRNRRSFSQAFKGEKTSLASGYDHRKYNQRSSVSDVTSMDTLQEIVLPGREEDNMPPLMTLIQTHLREMKT
jgi:hypothetical protein